MPAMRGQVARPKEAQQTVSAQGREAVVVALRLFAPEPGGPASPAHRLPATANQAVRRRGLGVGVGRCFAHCG